MPENYVDVLSFENEEITLTIFNHLSEMGFEDIHYYSDDEGMYHISCDSSVKEVVEQQLILFVKDTLDVYMTPTERVKLNSLVDNVIEAASPVAVSGESYVSAAEKYENEKSSAFSLIAVGLAGLIFIVLNFIGILHILSKERVLFTITMTSMFAIFLLVGLMSLKRMKKLKESISRENNLSEDIKNFLTNDIKPEIIDADMDGDLSEEEKYLYRLDAVMSYAKQSFDGADEMLIEHLFEEMYDEIFHEIL